MASRPRRWISTLGAFGAALALVLTGCSNTAAPKPTASNSTSPELKIGLSADVPDLKPSRDQGAAAMMLDTMIHRGLLGYDAKGQVVPALAESFKASADNKSFTFKLRKDLKFSDGSALTSANVKKTLEFLATSSSGAKIGATMSQLASVDTPDEQTAVVNLKNANVAFPSYLADTTAAILPDKAFGAQGTSWEGAGPFKLDQTQKGVSFTFSKNPNFYDASNVNFDKATVTVYADGQARLNALLAGDVHLIDFVPWESFDRVKQDANLSLDPQSGPWMYLHFNVAKGGPLANEKVRQAIALAVNRENVAKAAFSGQASVVAGAPISESSPFYNAQLAQGWKQDVAKAKQLMAEAGYANGFDAVLLTSSQYAFHQDTALSVQPDLAAIGIRTTLDSGDWATRQQKAAEGRYDIAVAGSAGVVNDPSFLVNFVTGPAANNRSYGFDDPKLDDLLNKGLQSATDADRKAVYDQVQERIIQTVPFASLVGRSQAFAYSKKLSGFANIPGFLTFESGYTLVGARLQA